MKKSKVTQLLVTVLAVVLVFAFATTALATSYTVTLYLLSDPVHTTYITTLKAHSAGFNQPYSTGNMSVRLQVLKNNEWTTVYGDSAAPNKTYTGVTHVTTSALEYRTQIGAVSGYASVAGVGSINNY